MRIVPIGKDILSFGSRSHARGFDGFSDLKKSKSRALLNPLVRVLESSMCQTCDTGEIMKGARYWKPMDVIFHEYLDHPESKFDGDTGILQRKNIQVSQIRYIGKESNRLEETDVIGVGKDGYEVYGSNPVGIDLSDPEVIKYLTPKMAKR